MRWHSRVGGMLRVLLAVVRAKNRLSTCDGEALELAAIS